VRNMQSHFAARVVIDERDLVQVRTPADLPRGAVCAIWNNLAARAVADGRDGLLILFGDDVSYALTDGTAAVEPGSRDWLTVIAPRVCDPSCLRLFSPLDATDPSCCTFPIVSSRHVQLFQGRLFPAEVCGGINQVHLYIYSPFYLSISYSMSFYISTLSFIHVIYLSFEFFIYQSIKRSIYLAIYINLPISTPIYLSIDRLIDRSVCLSRSFYLFVCPSVYLRSFPSICISLYLPIYL